MTSEATTDHVYRIGQVSNGHLGAGNVDHPPHEVPVVIRPFLGKSHDWSLSEVELIGAHVRVSFFSPPKKKHKGKAFGAPCCSHSKPPTKLPTPKGTLTWNTGELSVAWP